MTHPKRILRPVAAWLASGVIVAALLFISVPRVTAGDGGEFAPVDAHVRSAMEAASVPGLAYAIVRDGAIVHLAAFGTAGPGNRAMTAQTPVVIGSVGKSITALAIRQLVEAGRIDVNAPVTRYLPWFELAGPSDATERVTIQSLLNHTSGLSTADGQDPRWYAPGRTNEDVVRGLVAIRTDRPSGTYEYSNLNYVILGVVIEAVSGLPYGDYVRAHVYEPLGMSHSYTSLDAAAPAGPAQGHRYLFGLPVPFDEPYPTGMVAAGYHVSTAGDMARYVAALANGGVIDGIDVVTPGGPATGIRAFGTDWQALYGRGVDAIVSQSGSTLSSNADILVLPSSRLGVVVLLNANPTQLLGLPAGAAEIAFDVLRLSSGVGQPTSAPNVRSVYLAVDALLLALAAALAFHAIRARSWRRRLGESSHRRRLIARTVVADLVAPVVVLLGVPLWIGSTGSSPAGNIPAGWGFALWTLPDLAITLLVLALGGLGAGAAKLIASISANRTVGGLQAA